jgi:hypothetical protein
MHLPRSTARFWSCGTWPASRRGGSRGGSARPKARSTGFTIRPQRRSACSARDGCRASDRGDGLAWS